MFKKINYFRLIKYACIREKITTLKTTKVVQAKKLILKATGPMQTCYLLQSEISIHFKLQNLVTLEVYKRLNIIKIVISSFRCSIDTIFPSLNLLLNDYNSFVQPQMFHHLKTSTVDNHNVKCCQLNIVPALPDNLLCSGDIHSPKTGKVT